MYPGRERSWHGGNIFGSGSKAVSCVSWAHVGVYAVMLSGSDEVFCQDLVWSHTGVGMRVISHARCSRSR